MAELEIPVSGKAWGHAAGTLSDDYWRTCYWDRECSQPKCTQQPTHWIRYRYVTGRAGRTSQATKTVCLMHAQRFATKHGIEITSERLSPSATQVAIEQMLEVHRKVDADWVSRRDAKRARLIELDPQGGDR